MTEFAPTEERLPAVAGEPEIFYRRWGPASPRAVVLGIHGLGEHSGRYQNVVDALCPRGFALYIHDLRGHGRSGGKRGHVTAFSEYLTDTRRTLEAVRKAEPEKPLFLLGHSMGGLIAMRYATLYPEGLRGLVLSSASLKIKGEVPAVKAALGRLFSRLIPGLAMSNGLDPNQISRDRAVVKAYIDDPLVHDRVSARWVTEFVDAIAAAHREASSLSLPIQILQAGEDDLVDASGSRELFETITVKDRGLRVYDGYFHEIFNDLGKERVLDDLAAWLEERI